MISDEPPLDVGQKTRPLSRYLISMTGFAIAVIVVVPLYVLSEQRKDELRLIKTAISGQARIIAEHVDSSLEAVDLILRATVKDRERDLKTQARTDEEVTATLHSMIRRRAEVHRILVTDRTGEIIHANNIRSIGSNASSLRSFQIHVKRDKPGLFTGELVFNNKQKRQYLALSRPYFSPQGEFAGVAIAVLKRSYFVNLLNSVTRQEQFTATLLNKRGNIIATAGEKPKDAVYNQHIDTRLFGVPSGETALVDVNGPPFTESGVNIVAQTSVSDFPYMVMTSVPHSKAMAAWKRDAYIISAISIVALILVLVLFRSARAEGLKRVASEKKLLVEKERAEHATKAKSEFLSSMSHELRTPLNAIIGFAQILMTSKKNPLHEKQHRTVEHILNGGNHLLRLINDILDLSKVEAGRVELSMESTPVSTLLEECRNLTEVTAVNADIELVYQPRPMGWVTVDRKRAVQVLLNLVSNAIKYNRPNGSVSVLCHAIDDRLIRISVRDTGHGISEAGLKELFKPFNRVSAYKTEIEGTGIGLTIAKKLMEMMGGNMGVESEIGKGSIFWIDLPRTFDQPQGDDEGVPKNTPQLADDVGQGGKVVYIEDNQVNQLLMKTIFEELPAYTLILANDAERGLDLIFSENPDLILMDINLPRMSGYEALARLRNNHRSKTIPVIAVSAAAMIPDIQKGMEAGFFAYITKPFNVREVIDVCRRAMDRG